MGDLFGSAGPTGEQYRGTTPPDQEEAEFRMPEKFVSFDNVTGELTINIPPRFAKYKDELLRDLTQQYLYENPVGDVKDSIDQFISEWLSRKLQEEGA
jgi:hypothetical protein